MWRRLEVHFLEDGGNHVVPMFWRAAEAVESFIKEPELVFVVSRIAYWRTNDHSLVVREFSIAEGVFAVALLENTFIANSF